MKRIFILILSVFLLVCCITPINANDSIIVHEATELLNSAFMHNDLFSLPDVSNQDIFLSNPLKLYKKLNEDDYILIDNKEYYLIYTDDTYIAEIVVIYENDKIVSTTFNTSLANKFNYEKIKDDEFTFTLQDNEYIIEKTNSTVGSTNNIINKVTKMSNIYLSNSYTIQPRSGRVLNLNYISQGIYNTCWAASALVVGWYYKGTNIELTPYEIAQDMGISAFAGASMSKTQDVLLDYFGINTTVTSSALDKSVQLLTILIKVNQLLLDIESLHMKTLR